MCKVMCIFISHFHFAESVDGHYRNFEAHKALDEVMSCLRQANAFVQRQEPWNLVRNADDKPWLETVLCVALETLRVCGILLQPAIPNTAEKLLDRLGIKENERTWTHAECFPESLKTHPLGLDRGVLFTRIKSQGQS